MFTASFDLASFRRSADKTIQVLQFETRDAVQNAAVEGAQEARTVGAYTDRTGKLRAGIVAKFVRESELSSRWDIVSKAKYSKFVENGTKPHVILPRNGVALRFVVNGRVVFARKVNHPGAPPRPFFGPAYLKAERVLYRDLNGAIARVQRLWA